MLRYLLNGFGTSARLRFVEGLIVLPCPFCGELAQDTKQHWPVCPTLQNAMTHIYGLNEAQRFWGPEVLSLQTQLGGDDIQRVFACIHAVWRCRCIRVRGFTHADTADLASHLKLLIEDPWLHGDSNQSRSERRASRSVIPASLPNTYIYNADGASRAPRDQDRVGSFGALLRFNGVVIARVGVCLGPVTNNVAEYQGAIASLEHALVLATQIDSGVFCIRLDSYLVTQQILGQWACRTMHLGPYYEHALDLMLRLRNRPNVNGLHVQQVYREYNGEADGIANEALDRYTLARHPDGRVVDEHWADVGAGLARIRFVDAEGDFILPDRG